MGFKKANKKKSEVTDFNQAAEEIKKSKEVEKEEVKVEEQEKPVEEKASEDVKDKVVPGSTTADLTDKRKQEIAQLVFYDDITEGDLADLTIQETIFLLCNVDFVNENKPVVNYEEKCEVLDKVIAKKLLEADKLYITYDLTTRMPFITQGCVEIYSEEEFAKEAVIHYKTQYRNLSVAPFDKSKKQFPEGMNVFDFLFYLGMEHLLVDNGRYKTVVDRNAVLPLDNMKNPEKSLDKPIINPELRYHIIDFLQEAKWPVSYDKRKENMETKEQKMIDDLKSAKFLMPVQFGNEAVPKRYNQVPVNREKPITVPKLKADEEHQFTPIFTDWLEFQRMYPSDQWNGMVIDFNEAIEFNNEMGIVINPMSENLIMNKQSFEALKSREENDVKG